MAAASVLITTGSAAVRATKEQMVEHARQAESRWSDPGTNYTAICSAFIKPGTVGRDDLLNRLNPLLLKATNLQEKAAVNYLIGETWYWGGLAEVKRVRSKAAVEDVGDNVAKSFLAAWESVLAAERTDAAMELRQTIVMRFNQLLGTSVCGGHLSTNLKREVVVRYIDHLSPVDQAKNVWPIEQRARVFLNLGIQDRMLADVATAMPTNFEAVCDAMRIAWCVKATNEALRFATHLDARYQAQLMRDSQRWRDVANIYRASSHERTLPFLKGMTAHDPIAWLDIYEYAVRTDPSTPLTQRRGYAESYLQGVQATVGKSTAAYRTVLETLVANGDYRLTIELADQALQDRDFLDDQDRKAYIWRLKAVAHEKLGETERAADACRNGLAQPAMGQDQGVKTLLQEDLKRLSTQDKGKGDKG